ncbi:hypothetical protein A3Q56_03391 [Intoshia linei]|uniref:Uncharacterized protein n=1 Tax=Intoshia linei TaxID=1819745 RepID=A0A177B590_9BILA|nr:hypothetical protein A3Q56_03391 [Intoshia linei]
MSNYSDETNTSSENTQFKRKYNSVRKLASNVRSKFASSDFRKKMEDNEQNFQPSSVHINISSNSVIDPNFLLQQFYNVTDNKVITYKQLNRRKMLELQGLLNLFYHSFDHDECILNTETFPKYLDELKLILKQISTLRLNQSSISLRLSAYVCSKQDCIENIILLVLKVFNVILKTVENAGVYITTSFDIDPMIATFFETINFLYTNTAGDDEKFDNIILNRNALNILISGIDLCYNLTCINKKYHKKLQKYFPTLVDIQYLIQQLDIDEDKEFSTLKLLANSVKGLYSFK